MKNAVHNIPKAWHILNAFTFVKKPTNIITAIISWYNLLDFKWVKALTFMHLWWCFLLLLINLKNIVYQTFCIKVILSGHEVLYLLFIIRESYWKIGSLITEILHYCCKIGPVIHHLPSVVLHLCESHDSPDHLDKA